MEKKHRIRGPNFTNNECLLLCKVVAKYKHTIENKRTDGPSLVQKNKAWLKVAKEFNSISTEYSRTLESLQMNYKNLKRKAKKKIIDPKMDIPVDRAALIQNIEEFVTSSDGWEKVADGTGASRENCQKLFKVLSKEAEIKDKRLKKDISCIGLLGGGPLPKCDVDPLLDKLKPLEGSAIEGQDTICDGDSSIMAKQEVPPMEICNIKINEDSLTNYENEANGNNIDTGPQKLESEMPEEQSVSTKFSSLATSKLELVAMQKELLKYQLREEKEKLQHNQLLRAMELADAKRKYEHNESIRQLELEQLQNDIVTET